MVTKEKGTAKNDAVIKELKKENAIKELKKGIEKFKADAIEKGWEEDEVTSKIQEVYENFPWYKYNPPKKSWKSKIFNFLLYSFIIYLAIGAVLERNRRLKKRIDDYVFDTQISYHTQRVLRILTLPIFKVYDISVFHDSECLIANPFKTMEELDCSFCEGIESIPHMKLKDEHVTVMMREAEPVVLTDVPQYSDGNITFRDFKMMFESNKKELDEAACSIEQTNTNYNKISEYFEELEESTAVERNISIEWSNCHTYGTRFYRKLFPRPKFVSKESEIHFEKRIYILQQNISTLLPAQPGKSYYLYQLQGESEFEMESIPTCHYNCTIDPITVTLKKGEVGVIPNSGWLLSFKTISDGLNILYLSSFT